MKILAIDGNSLLNRAFYGVGPLNAPDGTPTNALYGFINILNRLIADENPDGLCVTQDLRAPTFRHKRFDQYKAGRRPMPDELAVQIPLYSEYLDICGIPRFALEGYEADDLLGTLAALCEKNGHTCLIATGDRDAFQLVSDSVTVLHISSRKGKTETLRVDVPEIRERYGLTPAQLIDLKALMGDSSDNIPGVPGVGEKTALELMRKYGGLDAIYEGLNTDDFKPGLFKKLTEGRDSAYMSRELALIDTNVPLEVDFKALGLNREVPSGLRGFYERLAFRKLLQKLPVSETAPVVSGFELPDVKIADTPALFSQLVSALRGAERVSFYALPDMHAFGFYFGGQAYAADCTEESARSALSGFWNSDTPKAGHHVKSVLRDMRADIPNIGMDTALAAYLLNPVHGQYSIETLAGDELGIELPFSGQESMFGLVSSDILTSLGHRAAVVDALAKIYDERLNNEQKLLLSNVELPLCRTLARMENTGFKLDTGALNVFGAQLAVRIEALTRTIYELAGQEFNIQSTKQLGDILFNRLQLPSKKKTKTGYSVDAEVLEQLRGCHEIIGPILEYRELCKLKSTYVDGLLSVCGADGRIRTTFQMTGTATGRLSSSEPNLQNIPVRRALGSELRRMFIPSEPDWVLVDADYSQIELRVLAHIAEDENMREAFRRGADIHSVTASQVFHVPRDEVTPEMRRNAKAVNFGIVFGISDFSLAGDIGVTRAEARRYIDSYLNNFSGVKRYMENVVARAKADGYVSTLLGRRRFLPELNSSNYNTRSFGERAALNTPIQGTAADIIKLAMIALDRRLRSENLRARLILQIHDELIVECPRQEAELVKALVKQEMEQVFPLDPPLVADAGTGGNWFEAK